MGCRIVSSRCDPEAMAAWSCCVWGLMGIRLSGIGLEVGGSWTALADMAGAADFRFNGPMASRFVFFQPWHRGHNFVILPLCVNSGHRPLWHQVLVPWILCSWHCRGCSLDSWWCDGLLALRAVLLWLRPDVTAVGSCHCVITVAIGFSGTGPFSLNPVQQTLQGLQLGFLVVWWTWKSHGI